MPLGHEEREAVSSQLHCRPQPPPWDPSEPCGPLASESSGRERVGSLMPAGIVQSSGTEGGINSPAFLASLLGQKWDPSQEVPYPHWQLGTEQAGQLGAQRDAHRTCCHISLGLHKCPPGSACRAPVVK